MNIPQCILIPGAERYRRKAMRGITFDMDRLVVEIQGEGFSYARVIFRDVVGFRVLDERDLCEFWQHNYHQKTGWLYEVKAGGWLELESTREILSNHLIPDMKEYFLADEMCLNVLCRRPPEIVDLGPVPPLEVSA